MARRPTLSRLCCPTRIGRGAFESYRGELLHGSLPLAGRTAAVIAVLSQAYLWILGDPAAPHTAPAALALLVAGVAAVRAGARRPDAVDPYPYTLALAVSMLALAGTAYLAEGDPLGWMFVGLLMTLLSLPLLLPLSEGETTAVAALCWGTFLVGLASASGPDPLDANRAAGHAIWLLFASLIALGASRVTYGLRRAEFLSRLSLEQERSRTRALLENVLPRTIVRRLEAGEEGVAESFDQVTVLFADIVGFTTLASQRSAEEVVAVLAEIFAEFDELVTARGLEKIKTIGDAYMVVGGAPTPRPDHAAAVADLGQAMVAALAARRERTGDDLDMRVGIHSGPAVAGVLGTTRFTYDLWGDTVNVASRLESHGVPGRVQVSSATHQLLPATVEAEARGTIDLKGKGAMETWLLHAPAPGA